MKSNVPWSVKGIDPEARAVAKEAARRANMTLGEWMNQMIREMGEEERPEDAPAPVSGVTTEQLRAVVDSLNRLNERLKTTEDELKVTEERQRQVSSDIGQGLETVFERMKRLERERREDAPEQLADRVEKLERGEGDKGRIEGLIKLESALTHMVEALEVTRAEALDKIGENEAAVQSLAARVEVLDDRLTAGFAEVHDAIDAVGQHLDRTERTAQAVISDAKEAAASTDAQFVEATSKRLMILGTEIKRSGDQIRTVEEMVSRLSDKIEAAEHRSAEGIGEVAGSLDALRREVLDGEPLMPVAETAGTEGDEPEAAPAQTEPLSPHAESLAEAAREADRKVSRLQRSYELMMARLEGRPVEDEPDAFDAPDAPAARGDEAEAAPTDASALIAPGDAEGADDADDADDQAEGQPDGPVVTGATSLDAVLPEDAPAVTPPLGGEAAGGDGKASKPEDDTSIGGTLAAGLGLAGLAGVTGAALSRRDDDEATRMGADSDVSATDVSPNANADAANTSAAGTGAASEDDADFDEIFGSSTAKAEEVSARSGKTSRAALSTVTPSIDAALPPGDTVSDPAASEARAAGSEKPDLASLTPRQKVLLAAKARKKRLEAERAGQDAEPAVPAQVEAAETDDDDALRDALDDGPLLASRPERERSSLPKLIGLLGLFLVAGLLGYFWYTNRDEGPQVAAPASVEPQSPNGRLTSPAPAEVPAAPSAAARANAIDTYREGVAAAAAGQDEAALRFFLDAQNDYVPARMRVGFAYLNGLGTDVNLSRARSTLQDAANSGNVAAMHLLGNIAADEDAGGVQVAEALDWFARAADYGNVNSMYNLGYLLDPAADHAIVPAGDRNAAEAYYWYRLAASLGDEPATQIAGDVGSQISPAARDAVEARVAAWSALPATPSVNDGLNPPEAPLE